MIITISGPPGSGTSTAARILSERLKMEVVSAGEIFRGLAKEDGLSLADFGEKAGKDHNIDLRLDKRMLEIARTKDNIIIEGRLTGTMLFRENISCKRVWITASLEKRIERIMGREKKDYRRVWKEVTEREERDWKRYMDIYGINLKDTSIYNIIIDNSSIGPKEVVDRIMEKL